MLSSWHRNTYMTPNFGTLTRPTNIDATTPSKLAIRFSSPQTTPPLQQTNTDLPGSFRHNSSAHTLSWNNIRQSRFAWSFHRHSGNTPDP
jgi:hypothetical protein